VNKSIGEKLVKVKCKKQLLKLIITIIAGLCVLTILMKMSGCFYKKVTFRYLPDNFIEYRSKDNAYSFQFWYLRNDAFVWLDEEWYNTDDLERLKDTMSCRLILEGRTSQGSFDYNEFTDYKIKDLKIVLKDESGNIVKENGVYYVFKDKERLRNNLRQYDSIENCILQNNDLSGNFYIEIFYNDKNRKIENMKNVYMEVKCILSDGKNDEMIYFKRELLRDVYYVSKEWFL